MKIVFELFLILLLMWLLVGNGVGATSLKSNLRRVELVYFLEKLK